ncbi:hypothetical protein ASE50_08655 [Sphingomonas sp. Leaf5]|nr:hypothetical protein ASE50_08655 [Sphingomonas sp. Leaf5]
MPRRLGRLAALVLFVALRPRQRLRLVLDGQDAVADRHAFEAQVHDPARALVRHDFEMIGFAADDDAQRDERVIDFRRIGDRDRTGYFQRTGHGHRLVFVPRRLDRRPRTFQEQVVQMVVKPRLDDQYLRHINSP